MNQCYDVFGVGVMPVINNVNRYVEVVIDNKKICKSYNFALQKPLLYIHDLNIPRDNLKSKNVSFWITSPKEFVLILAPVFVSSNCFGNKITDITFSCNTYVTYDLPKFKDEVKSLKRKR